MRAIEFQEKNKQKLIHDDHEDFQSPIFNIKNYTILCRNIKNLCFGAERQKWIIRVE